jgi:hypothetical protein
MSRKKLRLDRRRDFFLEIQPTVVFIPLEKFGSLSILVSFSADGDAAVESERAASEMVSWQPWFYPRLVAYGYFWLSERA